MLLFVYYNVAVNIVTLLFIQVTLKAYTYAIYAKRIQMQYLTNRLHFSVHVYCNRSQIMSERVKDKKVQHETKSSGVTVVLYTL